VHFVRTDWPFFNFLIAFGFFILFCFVVAQLFGAHIKYRHQAREILHFLIIRFCLPRGRSLILLRLHFMNKFFKTSKRLDRSATSRRVVIGGLFIGLTSSAWAAVGGTWLAGLGIVFYSVVLGLAIFRCPSFLLFYLLAAGAGVHIALVTIQLKSHFFCPACCTTALGAWLALCGAAFAPAFSPNKHLWPGVLGALAMAMLFHWRQSLSRADWDRKAASLLTQAEAASQTKTTNLVLVMVYERDKCKHCQRFEKEVLSQIGTNLQSWVTIERRFVTNDLPTPTILILGSHSSYLLGEVDWTTFTNAITASNAKNW